MTLAHTQVRIDDITIDLTRRKVFRGNKTVLSLPSLSFDTLCVLVKSAPAPVSTDDLINSVWNGSIVADDTVTQRIRLLRKALGDDANEPRYIETIRNTGYRLIPPVVAVDALPARRNRSWAIGVALAIILAGVAAWLMMDRQTPQAEQTDAPFIPRDSVSAAELSESARQLYSQRNPDSLAHAIGLYEQALAAEPDNPDIQAGLALALSLSVAWYGDEIALAERAEDLARQSLKGQLSFDAEMALGLSLDAQGRIDSAQAAYERAIALNPNHFGARASLAYLLQVKGRLVEALSHNFAAMELAPAGSLDVQVASCLRLLGFSAVATEWLERADQLNPGSAHAAPTRAMDLLALGDYQQAEQVIDAALDRGVVQVELFEYKAMLALVSNDYERARASLQSAPTAISHRVSFEVLTLVIDAATSGEHEAAAALADTLLEELASGDAWPGTYLQVAMLEVAARRDDRAITALQKLESAGERDYLWLQFLPPLQPLRSRVEFKQILERMRADTDYQRQQVLTTDWLPAELRDANRN